VSAEDIDGFERRLRRREALLALGGLGAGALALPLTGVASALSRVASVEGQATTAASCVLAREATEGPYWISNTLTRRDITDGQPGVPLSLHFTVVQATTCEPIPSADVEVWHADAGGVYSGGNVVHTGQVFFRDATSDAVYRTSSYRSRGTRDTTNARDGIYAQAGGSAATLKLTRRSGGAGYVGAITLGVHA
jgi:hypothetical protein